MEGRRPLVTLLLRIVPHYRVSFLRRLALRLQAAGINLQVLFGQERPGSEPRTVIIDEPWARCVPNFYAQFGSLEFVWQPAMREARGSDLIVVEQANRLLANYLLQYQRKRAGFQLAYWGHGRNMQQPRANSLTEQLKQSLSRDVDWWFAYTEISKMHVIRSGFPADRITVVNNTVDDVELAVGVRRWRHKLQPVLARDLGCASGNVAMFLGTFHKNKRLDFLFRAAQLVRERVPDFELLVVGDGPERQCVEDAARRHAWIRYAGPVLGEARAMYLRASKLLLMPGLVGLVIIDSFICECPLVTTAYPFHSPEIAYLDQEHNGVSTEDDVTAYAARVAALLMDDMELSRLRRGCVQSARLYSLRSMVENFAAGIEECLAQPLRTQVSLP